MPDSLSRDLAGLPCPVVESDDPAVLDRIAERDVAFAVWTRPGPAGLANWLDALPADRLPEGRFVAEPDDVAQRLGVLCDLMGLDAGPERAAMIADITDLAQRFARLAGAPRVDLRLEAVDHDSCWRFHRDHVGLRLNATYRGPGTQWPPLDQAARAARAQRRCRGPLDELPRFAAGLFKGVRRAGRSAILHRSPPIEGSCTTRLLLCLKEEADED